MTDIKFELTDWRYEVKFVVNTVEQRALENWISNCKFLYRSFEDRTVNSLYFEDFSKSAIRDNLAGISSRKKNRIRWYGDAQNVPPSVFETKIKKGRLGRKGRIKLGLVEFDFYQKKEWQKSVLMPNMRDLHSKIHDLKSLEPSVLVSYEREYFNLLMGIRMTVDREIKTYDPKSEPNVFTHSRKPFSELIVEFKCSVEQIDYLSEILVSFPFRASRHSKFMTGSYYLNQLDFL